jgi:hypothetical protein
LRGTSGARKFPALDFRIPISCYLHGCRCGFFGDSTPAVPFKEMRSRDVGTTSAEMRERVARARAIQHSRGYYNALRKLCDLDESGERTLEMAVRRMGLSARANDCRSGRRRRSCFRQASR